MKNKNFFPIYACPYTSGKKKLELKIFFQLIKHEEDDINRGRKRDKRTRNQH